MRTSIPTLILSALSLFASIATADLHYSGLCVDYVGDQPVYNDAATQAACTAYKNRNTGGEQWDTCPDCAMVCPFSEIVTKKYTEPELY
jgi:hypothetical protein